MGYGKPPECYRFEKIKLVPREWHEDNQRAYRETVQRKNFPRILRRAFGQPHEPIQEIKPDIGKVHNIEDFF